MKFKYLLKSITDNSSSRQGFKGLLKLYEDQVLRSITMSSERKAPAAEGNHNTDFCDALMEIAAYEKNVNRNSHKYNAYRKAAEILSKLDHRIESGAEAQQLPGVGASIARKIDEIIQTGKLKKLDLIRDDDESVAVNQLTRVREGPFRNTKVRFIQIMATHVIVILIFFSAMWLLLFKGKTTNNGTLFF